MPQINTQAASTFIWYGPQRLDGVYVLAPGRRAFSLFWIPRPGSAEIFLEHVLDRWTYIEPALNRRGR
jgi:hypothetical protein